jgi:hypothetical protein
MSYLCDLCLFIGGLMSYLCDLCLLIGGLMSYLCDLCLFIGGLMSYCLLKDSCLIYVSCVCLVRLYLSCL